jgi:hemolysin activation/secretion protein
MRRLIALAAIALYLAPTTRVNAQSTPAVLAPYVLGSSVYSIRDLTPEIAGIVGKPASATSLDALRAAIRTRYVRDGYISPIIAIPAEDMSSQTPRVYIHEARIEEIAIKGDPGPYRARIEDQVRALRTGALRKESLREALLRIRELPGITSRPLFDPRPEEPNTFRLVLNLGYEAVSGEVDANNGGTRDLGRVIYAGTMAFNGLLGAGEQLQLRGATSSQADRYKYVDAKATRWFGATLQMFLDGGGSTAIPDPNTHFSDRNLTLGLRRLLLASGSNSLVLFGTLHGDDSVLHDAGNAHLIDDRIRSVSLGLQLEHAGTLAQTSTYLTVDHAANLLSATSLDSSDSEVNIAFTKYVFGMTQSVSLSSLWKVRLDIYGQATGDVLPVVERYAFGGLGFGEAFDPASLVGDSGATVTAEIGHALTPHLAGVQYATLFARADYGIAWNNASYLPRKDDAASMSVGVLGKWNRFSGTLSMSAPVLQPEYTERASSLRALLSAAWSF